MLIFNIVDHQYSTLRSVVTVPLLLHILLLLHVLLLLLLLLHAVTLGLGVERSVGKHKGVALAVAQKGGSVLVQIRLWISTLVKLPQLGVRVASPLDHEGHGNVLKIVPPGELEDDVGAHQIVARKERGSEALLLVLGDEEVQEFHYHSRILALRGGFHRVLVQLIRLEQLDGFGELLLLGSRLGP